jgi:hypothetical protein
MTLAYRDRVAAYLKAHPGQWVDGMTLSELGGCYAWRSRVSDARRELGMTIENRQRRMGRRVISEYRFVPPSPPAQRSLLEAVSA